MILSRNGKVVLATLAVLALAVTAYSAGKGWPPAQKVVRAERFELVTADGQVRGAMWVQPDGTPRAVLYDKQGRELWAAPAQPEAATQDTSAPIVNGWRRVASWSGTGPKNTEKFFVRAPWKIVWDTRPHPQFGNMNFIIHVHGDKGMPYLAANVIGADQGETIQHESGTYYLKISGSQPYTITVYEKVGAK